VFPILLLENILKC